jgi:hypothetical protein
LNILTLWLNCDYEETSAWFWLGDLGRKGKLGEIPAKQCSKSHKEMNTVQTPETIQPSVNAVFNQQVPQNMRISQEIE